MGRARDLAMVISRAILKDQLYDWIQYISSRVDRTADSQAFFVIDSVNGNDATGAGAATASDAALTPLQTHTRFRQLIGSGPLQQNTTISIPNGLAASDTFDTMYDPGIYTVTYNGSLTTVLAAQSIAAAGYTPRVVGTNTPNQLKINGAPFVWAPYIGGGNFLRMTSGAANGLFSTVALDQTLNVARVGSFLNVPTLVETQPAAGDTFDIVRVPTIACPSTSMRVQAGSSFVYNNLRFLNDLTMNASIYALVANAIVTVGYFNNCCFANIFAIAGSGGAAFINCQGMAGFNPVSTRTTNIFSSVSAQLIAGVYTDPTPGLGNYKCLGRMLLRRGVLFQGTRIIQDAEQGATAAAVVTAQDVGFFDTVNAEGALVLQNNAYLLAQTLWGNTGTGNPPAAATDRRSHVYLLGTGQTLTNAGGIEIKMPLTANTTWAAARAALGVKDGATSDATIMTV